MTIDPIAMLTQRGHTGRSTDLIRSTGCINPIQMYLYAVDNHTQETKS